jgi:hypothetical protein
VQESEGGRRRRVVRGHDGRAAVASIAKGRR